MIALISIYGTGEHEKSHYQRLLYDLLAQRKPYMNISHKVMPTYEEHVKFVESKPYKDWHLVQDRENYKFVGSVYLTKKNEIGIFLFEEFRHRGYGTQILEALYESYLEVQRFKANIAPDNSGSLAFFVNKGFKYYMTLHDVGLDHKIIQHTYIKLNPYYDE